MSLDTEFQLSRTKHDPVIATVHEPDLMLNDKVLDVDTCFKNAITVLSDLLQSNTNRSVGHNRQLVQI